VDNLRLKVAADIQLTTCSDYDYCAILSRLRDIATYRSKIGKSLYPPVFGAPQGVTPSEFGMCFTLIKLEWLGYRVVKKLWQCVKSFYRIPERNGQTDGRTDGQTDIIAVSLSRLSMLTRDKNVTLCRLWPRDHGCKRRHRLKCLHTLRLPLSCLYDL